ncbi:MAG: precorrin-4 C(11)-methyltransferase [Desulforhabdus sp.]|jgi:precorrin-4/cobalt-precorrin-4 C11-methyltransferase|nr:precorrin-4 C(11)-methyltransferase [Desulforhabdus sp.]
MKYPIHFVGAGPGDPELITVKGRRLLEAADLIVYAGSLVPDLLLECCKPDAVIVNSASLTLSETHKLLVEGYRTGQRVVRLHTGDPGLYGAIQEQMALLDEERIHYLVVPGVSAVFAAAAALKQELTLPEISQTLILTRLAGRTPVPEEERLSALASHKATLVIYLSIQQIEKVASELQASYGPDTPVVVAYRVGWPDELLLRTTLAQLAHDVKASGIHRQALIMVGEVFAVRSNKTLKKSKLYDESFSHGFRKT